MTQRTAVRAALLLALAAGAAWGAARLAFWCDDAFITFRHVANAYEGHGLVWNRPPFAPVEGYTGFSWALLLWACWSWFGVEPWAAANPLSIAFGLSTLGLIAVAAFRVRDRDGRSVGDAAALLAVAALAGNRTFLQWTTGGLETALFNLAAVGWVLLAFRAPARRGPRWLLAWSATAAAAALTRPDGLLPAAATMVVALASVLQRQRSLRQALLGLLPLASLLAHVLWRRWFYGEWLPNTYYAKVTAPWPEAGLRYLYNFVFEHGLWVWGLVAAAWLWRMSGTGALAASRLWRERLPALAAVAATAAHVGYYTLRVGGDHFEYRVLSHLVPLAVVSLLAMATALSARTALPLCALLLSAAAGGVGWLQHALVTPQMSPAYDTLAPKLPAWARPLVRQFDRNQVWLNLQFNGIRAGAHGRMMAANLAGSSPAARHRLQVDPDDVPVVEATVIGLLGWMVPDVAVIDRLGLCDWVVARTPQAQWQVPLLPRDQLRAALAASDPDRNGVATPVELGGAFGALPGWNDAAVAYFVDLVTLLFAGAPQRGLTTAELHEVDRFLGNLRFMAHERLAPRDYVAAFDPNVTFVDGRVVVRRRESPLTPDRVRAIEAEWRQRLRGMGR